MKASLQALLSTFIALSILFVVWMLGAKMGLLPKALIPSPYELWLAFQEFSGPLFDSAFKTLDHTLRALGWALLWSFAIGIPVGYNPWISGLFSPIFVFFQTVPLIAIAPLIIIWVGFHEGSIVVMASIVCFFVLVNGVITGIRVTHNQAYMELKEWLDVSPWAAFWLLDFPQWIPSIFSALRPGFGLALVGATVGEFMIGSGLGAFIEVARAQNRVDLVFLAILVLLVIGLISLGFLNLFEKSLQKIRPFWPPKE